MEEARDTVVVVCILLILLSVVVGFENVIARLDEILSSGIELTVDLI